MTDHPTSQLVGSVRRVRGPDLVTPIHRPVDTDGVPEFHATRLLILLATCGSGSPKRISGRTKLAKLDFFLRYPGFLTRALDVLRARGQHAPEYAAESPESEAPMIRYRYGPWDPRYGDFLAVLESRGLVRVVGTRVDSIELTAAGTRLAWRLMERDEFGELRVRGDALAPVLATWTGTALKNFVYELFPTEVGARQLRERIEP